MGQREPDSPAGDRSPGLGEGDVRGWVCGSGTVCGERDMWYCSTSSSAEYQPSLSSSLAVL